MTWPDKGTIHFGRFCKSFEVWAKKANFEQKSFASPDSKLNFAKINKNVCLQLTSGQNWLQRPKNFFLLKCIKLFGWQIWVTNEYFSFGYCQIGSKLSQMILDQRYWFQRKRLLKRVHKIDSVNDVNSKSFDSKCYQSLQLVFPAGLPVGFTSWSNRWAALCVLESQCYSCV